MASAKFALYLGAPALNFVATVGSRAGKSIERIPTPAQLARWLRASELLAAGIVPSSDEYRDAIELREAIYRVGSAIVTGDRVPAKDVATINAAAATTARSAWQLNARTLARDVAPSPAPVRAALARIAENAIVVFAEHRAELTACEGEGCTALMLSNSRSARRRWCSMETCGNRAKVAAYRARTAETSSQAEQALH